MTELTKEDAVQHLIKNHNFKPGQKYKLKKIKEIETKTGGTIWNTKDVNPAAHIKLPRDPTTGWSIYDLRSKKDFSRYFEEQFQDFPDGKYAAYTQRGGDKGFGWFFVLDYRNNEVVNWYKKSKATNTREYSSSYYAFPDYFRIRQDWNV
ncbi:hypothetical protein OB919_21490 [Halobacteria archaeon AArc-curdl1]|uniref:Uncharacterized protein n=1 Tax=Natronosalvus hydrolyticus TaxID=2979988 RepID=A0AAP3E9X3_9EURY|nr:hypothetical protein [Halobacteria archaeon AArc-curdl1]